MPYNFSNEKYIAYLKDLGINYYDFYNGNDSNQNVEKETKEEPYWKYIQGHLNPYGKELYDYVEEHKNIKISKDEVFAAKDLKELDYKIRSDKDNLEIPTLLCEKSFPRMLFELLFILPDLL